MARRERGHRLSIYAAHERENTRAALAGRVTLEEGVREIPLGSHDLAPIALECERRLEAAQLLPLTQKPSEMTLEGFYRERVSPARGGCGRRG
jgi:hypothetical protein